MHQRSTILRIPSNARSAATAPKIQVGPRSRLVCEKLTRELQPIRLRQVSQSETDRTPEPGAFRRILPHFASQQRQVKLAERGSFRSNTPTPQPQPRPQLTSHPSPPQPNEHGFFRPVAPEPDTKSNPSPLSRLSKLKFKERGSLLSGHPSVKDTKRGSGAQTGRSHGKTRERDGSRGSQPKRVHVDLYIPSTVSVGQLAKLLNVRLRMVDSFSLTSGLTSSVQRCTPTQNGRSGDVSRIVL